MKQIGIGITWGYATRAIMIDRSFNYLKKHTWYQMTGYSPIGFGLAFPEVFNVIEDRVSGRGIMNK